MSDTQNIVKVEDLRAGMTVQLLCFTYEVESVDIKDSHSVIRLKGIKMPVIERNSSLVLINP